MASVLAANRKIKMNFSQTVYSKSTFGLKLRAILCCFEGVVFEKAIAMTCIGHH